MFVGIDLRRVKSLLFCHVEYLYEFKCKKLSPDVAAIAIIHVLNLVRIFSFTSFNNKNFSCPS